MKINVARVVAFGALASLVSYATAQTKPVATRPAEATTFAGFGVTVPAAPAGFARSPWLQDYLLASTVMEWRRVDADGHVDAGGDDASAERIQLIWRSAEGLSMGGQREGALADPFLEAAINPFGSVASAAGAFPVTAKPVPVPHKVTQRTVRYARSIESPDAEGIACTEATAVRGIEYILIYRAGAAATAEGRAAFDAIAAALAFSPPKTFAQTLGTGSRVVTLPPRVGFTVALPEPFRDIEEGATHFNANELTPFIDFAATAQAGGELEDFSATLRFLAGGRDVPKDLLDGGDEALPRRAKLEWTRDEADTRIAKPTTDGSRRKPKSFYLVGHRVDGERWLWALLVVPEHLAKELGDGSAAAQALNATVTSARPIAADGGTTR